MATNVLLLHYNNYFNRKIKKLETVAEYKAADSTTENNVTVANYSECLNINFNPGDGIVTSLILGYGTNPSSMFNPGANYDYLVVVDHEEDSSTTPPTVTETINSRWFIMEAHRTRGKQIPTLLGNRKPRGARYIKIMDKFLPYTHQTRF